MNHVNPDRVFTPRVTKILGNADEVAHRREVNYVDTSHLLLGLLEDNESDAFQVIVETVGYESVKKMRKKLNERADNLEGKTVLWVRRGEFKQSYLDSGVYCKNHLEGCFCQTGWPLEKTCPHCRDQQDQEPEAYRASYCFCPKPEKGD